VARRRGLAGFTDRPLLWRLGVGQNRVWSWREERQARLCFESFSAAELV